MSSTPLRGAGGGFILPPNITQSQAATKGEDASPAGKAGAASTSFSSGSIKSERNVGISKRSLPALAVSAPIYLISGTIAGISAKVKKGSFKAAFTGEMKKLSAQAKGGISDSYKSLKPGKGNAKEIAQQNYRYAGTINGESSTALLDEGEGKWNSSFATEKGLMTFDNTIDRPVGKLVDNIKSKGFKQAYISNKPVFYNPSTGTILRIACDHSNKELVVAFLGMGNQNFLKDAKGNPIDSAVKAKIDKAQLSFVAKESLGAVTSGGKEAIEIGHLLQEAAKEANLTPVVTGHSHGGGLAQCAAAGNGIKGVVFNSRPMGGAIRKHIGQNKVAENAKQVTAFCGKGDWLSNTRPLNALAVAFERATGVTVPRTIGKGYNIPKGDVNYSQHNAFQAQLEKLLFD